MREELQLDFDLELLVPSGDGWAPLQSLEGVAEEEAAEAEELDVARKFILMVVANDVVKPAR